jgi:hypothetical protein
VIVETSLSKSTGCTCAWRRQKAGWCEARCSLSTVEKLTRVPSSWRGAPVEEPHERAVEQACEITVEDIRVVARRCSRSRKEQVVLREGVLSSGGFVGFRGDLWVSRGSNNFSRKVTVLWAATAKRTAACSRRRASVTVDKKSSDGSWETS